MVEDVAVDGSCVAGIVLQLLSGLELGRVHRCVVLVVVVRIIEVLCSSDPRICA